MSYSARAASPSSSSQVRLSTDALAAVRRTHESYLVDLVTAAQFVRRMRDLAQLPGVFGGGEDGAAAQQNAQSSIAALETFIGAQQETVESLWEECRSWGVSVEQTDEASGRSIRALPRDRGF